MSREKETPPQTALALRENRAFDVIKRLIRSVAASFPYAASLAQAYNEWESFNLGRRLEEFLANFSAELESLKSRMADLEKRLHESAEECPALLEVTIERVQREVNKEKRQRYARLLGGCLASGSLMPTEDKITLIQQLETLTTQDLCVLRLLGDGKGRPIRKVQPKELGWEVPGEQFIEALVASISKLESRGLVTGTPATAGVNLLTGDGDWKPKNWADMFTTRTMWLLPLGRKLVDLLRLQDEPTLPSTAPNADMGSRGRP